MRHVALFLLDDGVAVQPDARLRNADLYVPQLRHSRATQRLVYYRDDLDVGPVLPAVVRRDVVLIGEQVERVRRGRVGGGGGRVRGRPLPARGERPKPPPKCGHGITDDVNVQMRAHVNGTSTEQGVNWSTRLATPRMQPSGM